MAARASADNSPKNPQHVTDMHVASFFSNPAIRELDDPSAFDKLRLGIHADLKPQGILEQSLADKLALNTWRQNLLSRYELAATRQVVESAHASGWRKIHETRRDRAMLGNLDEILSKDGLMNTWTAVHVLESLATGLGVPLSGDQALGVDDDGIPGFDGEDSQPYDKHVEWTSETLKAALELVAGAAGYPLNQAVKLAIANLKEVAKEAFSQMRRAKEVNVIPTGEAAKMIFEYGSFLRAEFEATAKELRAFQTTRRRAEIAGRSGLAAPGASKPLSLGLLKSGVRHVS